MTERHQPSVSGRHADHRQVGHSVWLTAQTSHYDQRAGRYLARSRAHPDRLPPAIARYAIQHHTHPGDLVIDPMCGTGTTLVEAVHLGRDALGVDLDARWTDLTERNLALAMTTGATGLAAVTRGDARGLPRLLAPLLSGRAALVLATPPTGLIVPGSQRDRSPGCDASDLGCMPPADRQRALARILTATVTLLAPGGLVVLTSRAHRHGRHLVDPTGDLIHAAEAAGLRLLDRCAALLTGLRDDRVIPRLPVTELHDLRATQSQDHPLLAVAHQDVLIFRAATDGTAT